MSVPERRSAVAALERELARRAPAPDFEFLVGMLATLAGPVAAPPPAGRGFGLPVRAAATAGVSAALVAGLASTGGVGYAASSFEAVGRLVQRAATSSVRHPVPTRVLSAGSDQYRPGFGFGDPNHNHTGPPGLAVSGATPGGPPPTRLALPTKDGLAATVTAAFTLDEQAHLYISVVDRTGKPLLLTQRSKRGGSSIGDGALTGPQTKFIQYAVLVPRRIALKLRVPVNLLVKGQTYRIRIVAIDFQGNKTRAFVPFRQT